jgi:hypothetical protein
VWLYRAHLGFPIGGRIFVIEHCGRKSESRYLSGLETLERRALADVAVMVAFTPAT